MKLAILLLAILSLPLAAQPVLTIRDARQMNEVAPYTYFLKRVNPKLTYDQVAQFPLDSFESIHRKEVVQLARQNGTSWLMFQLKNQTTAELFLISSFRQYGQFDVFILDEKGKQTHVRSGLVVPDSTQLVMTNPPVIPLGSRPQKVYVQVRRNGDAFGDYWRVGDMSQALLAKQQTTRWQSIALGVFLLMFVFSLVFFLRLRTPLLGWYALLMCSIVVFYIDYYQLLNDYKSLLFWRFIPLFNSVYFYELCWSLFHIRFLNLRHYSRFLYWAIIVANALTWIDDWTAQISKWVTGSSFSYINIVLGWFGFTWASRILLVLYLLLISLLYVNFKNFRQLFLYTIAFVISVVTMIVALFAWNNFEWLPFIPYNNSWVLGIVIEVIILGYILGERADEYRRQQARTQQQLIVQLQENLRQQNKLLQLRDEIARDLHDEVGATLTGIATSAKVIEKKMGHEQEEVKAVLGQMTTDSQEAIHTIRDTIWALNPDNDAPDKLVEKMKSVGFKLLMPHGIAFAFENEVPVSQLPVFSMEQRRNLYLVYKEALHNIAKHSEATNAQVRIFQQNADLHVRISDDGKGFDAAQNQEGNGLKNFQKRAKEGGFEVKVKSAEGVEVEIIILFNHKVHHE